MNNFQKDLQFSHKQTDHAIWRQLYTKAFPTFVGMQKIIQDGWAQRAGIDRVILLSSGKNLTVDEKLRRESYPDIALEYQDILPNGEHIRPGWIEKDLACDFIAYAFLPTQTGYILPFQQLRVAWLRHGESWKKVFFQPRAENPGYITVSVAVPVPVLFAALNDAMFVQL